MSQLEKNQKLLLECLLYLLYFAVLSCIQELFRQRLCSGCGDLFPGGSDIWGMGAEEYPKWEREQDDPWTLRLHERYSFIVIPLYRFINMLCIPSWILEPQLRVHQAQLINSSPTLADQHKILLAWSTGRMSLCFLIKALLNTHYIGIQIQA